MMNMRLRVRMRNILAICVVAEGILLAGGAVFAGEGFFATQGEGRGEDLTRIYDKQGNLVKKFDCYGQAVLLDGDGSLFIGESTPVAGKYAVLRYPYLGGAEWGAAQEYCVTDGRPRALARDSASGALYIGLDTSSSSNVYRCAGPGGTPVLFCGVNDRSQQIQDMEVGPDGRVWLGLYSYGYLRYPMEGGFVPDLTIKNEGKAGGFAFAPSPENRNRVVLYGSVNGNIRDFGWYDCETGAQLGKLFNEEAETFGNYCMTFGPDRTGDGIADIYVCSYSDSTRIYDGKSGAALGDIAGRLPNVYVSGVASVAPVAAPVFQPAPQGAKIHVACVGDSITRGEAISNRSRYSYPAQLQRMLGDGYQVRNFGYNGAMMARKGYRPYWNLQEFKDATEYDPQIVVIMLGTNDSYPEYWREGKGQFKADGTAMVEHFLGVESRPKVWLCLPIPIGPARGEEQPNILSNEVIPILRQIAVEKNVPLIDMYQVMTGKLDLLPDGVHPDADGARLIAMEVCRAIAAK